MPLQIFARGEASRKPDIGGIAGRRLVDVGAAGIRQPSTRATLSYASPAASSMVEPSSTMLSAMLST